MSAAHATLEILANTNALKTIDESGEKIRSLLGRVFTGAGIEHSFAGPPAMLGIHFSSEVPQNYRQWRKVNNSLYKNFAWKLIEYGVMLEPDSREPWFICEAHEQIDFAWLEDVVTRAIRAVL